ncbi:hypothetical protein [Nioella nitratireducens]|uniref:hypothetical protein n=1 Tax=Nioella nitratireducens TaxID=1287720 RepID=UPI0008FD48C9|nr:hypothetical protein [Nioella nitratireducens]
MILAPDLLIALSTLVLVFAIASALSVWSDGSGFPTVALAAIAAGVGVFLYAYWQIEPAPGWRVIPDSFISVFARILH